MNDNHTELTDEERERLLHLILIEANGATTGEQLRHFPSTARNLFRRVVVQAGLVKVKELNEQETEHYFVEPRLSEKGARRLKELNMKFGGGAQS